MRHLKRTMPTPVRRMVRRAQRRLSLSRAVRRIADAPPGQVPGKEDLSELRFGWGNTGWSADLEYMHRVASLGAETHGPILECGSGLTTLLLGLTAGRRGVPIYSLEHHSGWHGRVTTLLERYGVKTHLVHAPLESYGEFDWYSPPLQELPSDFEFVVCDGPPADTRGGRYGLMPVMKDHLAGNARILLDDAGREDEIAVLERWSRETGARYSFFGDADVAALVTLG